MRFRQDGGPSTDALWPFRPAPSAANAPRTLSANPDPGFGLIEDHKKANVAHSDALDEQNRLERIGDPDADRCAEAPCHADNAAFFALIGAVPTTLAGVTAVLRYLNDLAEHEAWRFDEGGRDATHDQICSGVVASSIMTRRTLMNTMVALPLVAASPVASPLRDLTPDRRALEVYASWLFMEQRILCGELWPHMGAEAEKV